MRAKADLRDMILTALFFAIMLVLAFAPLGFIPIGPINATTMHIPVIIGSIVLGPKRGAFLGFSFGIASVIRATIAPTVTSFVFSPFIPVIGSTHGSLWALLVAIGPRICIGLVPYFVYQGLKKLFKEKAGGASLFIAGLAGSMTNTILVMGLIALLFGGSYAQAIGTGASAVYGVILALIFTSGVPEAIVAALASAGVCAVLLKLMKKA